MKIAADYGFCASNNGFENARALQNAVLGGGEILIDKPGVYEIADQILLDDDTTLRFCEVAYLKSMDNPTLLIELSCGLYLNRTLKKCLLVHFFVF